MLVVAWMAACGGSGEPPTIVSLEVSREFLGEGAEAEITLTVDDPDGINNIESATITEGNTGLVLVELGEPPDDGVYTATVTWDDFVALAPLDFEGTERRPLVAVVTDRRGNVSAEERTPLTLRCRQFGGIGVGDRCYNVATIGARASSSCFDVCELSEFGFQCDTKAALEAFDDVGSANFDVDDNGTIVNVTLDLATCDTVASTVSFNLSSGPATISAGSQLTYTCTCVRGVTKD